jgi:hypothetical protein
MLTKTEIINGRIWLNYCERFKFKKMAANCKYLIRKHFWSHNSTKLIIQKLTFIQRFKHKTIVFNVSISFSITRFPTSFMHKAFTLSKITSRRLIEHFSIPDIFPPKNFTRSVTKSFDLFDPVANEQFFKFSLLFLCFSP